MKTRYIIFLIIFFSSIYCHEDESQINLEGRVTDAHTSDPIPSTRVELRMSTGGFTEILSGSGSSELLASTETDSFGNYMLQKKIENCSRLGILATKDGFSQTGSYRPICTTTRWQIFDIRLERGE
jgi:hypothetical protein